MVCRKMRLKAVKGIVLMVLLMGMLTLTFNIDGQYVLADPPWHIETVDSTGDMGWYTSIALDSSDKPHISYWDMAGDYLRYAYREAPPPPVGGFCIPVDKLNLLAPYIGLASTILAATAATAIYVKRVKYRKEEMKIGKKSKNDFGKDTND